MIVIIVKGLYHLQLTNVLLEHDVFVSNIENIATWFALVEETKTQFTDQAKIILS